MVVFEDGLARKCEYRRFVIRGQAGQGDTASISRGDHAAVPALPGRALRDRARRAPTRSGTTTRPEWRRRSTRTPGGRAASPTRRTSSSSTAALRRSRRPQRALDELGIDDVALCGLAKRLEEVWLPGDAAPGRAAADERGPLPAAAGARRGAPLRDRSPPHQALQVDDHERARRRSGTRRDAPQGAAATLRLGQAAFGGNGRGDHRGSRHRSAHRGGHRARTRGSSSRPRRRSTPPPARSSTTAADGTLQQDGQPMSTKPKKPTAVPLPGAGDHHRACPAPVGARRPTCWRTSAGSSSTTCRRVCCRRWPSSAAARRATCSGSRRSSTYAVGTFFADLTEALGELADRGNNPRIIFLEAERRRRWSDGSRTYADRTRCRATVGSSTASPASARCCATCAAEADIVIDTSSLNVHELGAKVLQAFEEESAGLRATVISFGYKYGLPVDADLVLDCRFLPNPHWVPELRPMTGLERAGARLRAESAGSGRVPRQLRRRCSTWSSTGYRREGKRYATIAVGCTGGKHRSVAIAEELARRLRQAGSGRLDRAPRPGSRVRAS